MNRKSRKIQTHRDLIVYQKAFETAMRIFEVSKKFPKEETYSLTHQMRRSSRSVCTNMAEAWSKRLYKAHFISKLSDSESEAAETQVWLEFAVHCGFLDKIEGRALYKTYGEIIRTIIGMITHTKTWIISRQE